MKEELSMQDLHLYILGKAMCRQMIVNGNDDVIFRDGEIAVVEDIVSYYWQGDFIKMLRPLSNMTPDEFRDIVSEPNYADSYCLIKIAAINTSLHELHRLISNIGRFDTMPKLLAMDFDIFFWIEAGLAIPYNLNPDGTIQTYQ